MILAPPVKGASEAVFPLCGMTPCGSLAKTAPFSPTCNTKEMPQKGK